MTKYILILAICLLFGCNKIRDKNEYDYTVTVYLSDGETVVYKNPEYIDGSYGDLILKNNGYTIRTNCFFKIEKVKKGGVK